MSLYISHDIQLYLMMTSLYLTWVESPFLSRFSCILASLADAAPCSEAEVSEARSLRSENKLWLFGGTCPVLKEVP